MRGKNFLKVTGILLIIFGGIGVISSIRSFKTESVYILNAISNMILLVAGILGVAYCKKPDKAKLCLVSGILMLIWNAFSIILQLTSNDSAVNSIVPNMSVSIGIASGILAFVISSILPVLYIVGAVLNLKDRG